MDARTDIALCAGQHAVQFYEDDSELALTVASHAVDALSRGGVAVVIATECHCRLFRSELARAGVDASAIDDPGRLQLLDAGATMSQFITDGRIDPAAFRRVIGSILSAAAERSEPVFVFGEMVALLWDAGDVLGAIKLEELWNELGEEWSLYLLCAYASQSIAGEEHAEAVEEIHRLHSSVVSHGRPPCYQHPGGPLELSRELETDARSAHEARQIVIEALSRCGHDRRLIDDAQLVISELVTNAIIHAQTRVSVLVRAEPAGVHLEVRDFNFLRPTHRKRGPSTGLGMGLQLVAALAGDWGIEPAVDGKTVWADLRA